MLIALPIYVSAGNTNLYSFHRLSKSTRKAPDFKKRYAWHCSQFVAQLLLVVFLYSFIGSTLINMPQDYQWVLVLFTPLVLEICTRLMLEVAYRSAGKKYRGKYSVKLPVIQFVASKHSVFLAVMLGGVATPASTYVIIILDVVDALSSGLKIIYKMKYKHNEDIEGKC